MPLIPLCRYNAVQSSLQQLASSIDSCNSFHDGLSLSSSISTVTADAARGTASLGSSLRASTGGLHTASTLSTQSKSDLSMPRSLVHEVVVPQDVLGNSIAAPWSGNHDASNVVGPMLDTSQDRAAAAPESIRSDCGPVNSCWWPGSGDGQSYAESQLVSSPTPSGMLGFAILREETFAASASHLASVTHDCFLLARLEASDVIVQHSKDRWSNCHDKQHMLLAAGRSETFSPSRGERLAQLKRRQNEKRGTSAAGGARMDFRDYTPSPDCSPSCAAAQSMPVHPFSNQGQPAGVSVYSSCGGSVINSQASDAQQQWPQGSLDSGSWLQPPSVRSSAGRQGGGDEVAVATVPSPAPLLKWNLHMPPDSRPLVQHQVHQQPYEQKPPLHLQSAPGRYRPDTTGDTQESQRSFTSSTTSEHRYGSQHSTVSNSNDPISVRRTGLSTPLSAAAAEAPIQSSAVHRRSSLSAAPVLTGAGAGASEGADGTADSGSPTIRQRRVGPGAAIGLQQPASASSAYPGASKSSALNHRSAGSSGLSAAAGGSAQLRAQTAAAAVGLNADWAAGRYGSGSESPVPGTGSPSSRRGSAIERPQSVGPEGDPAELAPLTDPETRLRYVILLDLAVRTLGPCAAAAAAHRQDDLLYRGRHNSLTGLTGFTCLLPPMS